MYGGQHLNDIELAKQEMVEKLRQVKNATFTYSRDFQSATIIIPEERHEETKWLTSRGFVYPAAKTVEEYRRHPRDVSETRKDDLRQPWIDPGRREQHDQEDNNLDPKPKFDSIACKSSTFGGTWWLLMVVVLLLMVVVVVLMMVVVVLVVVVDGGVVDGGVVDDGGVILLLLMVVGC